MANKCFYFGTREVMDWVISPQVNIPRTAQKFTDRTDYQSGGTGIYQGPTGARIFELDWPIGSAEDVSFIRSVEQGLYAGNNSGFDSKASLIYFLDPFAMGTNILPAFWASPFLADRGSPSLMGYGVYNTSSAYRSPEGYRYPTHDIRYGGEGGVTFSNTTELWIPVPEGYTFHMGHHTWNDFVGELPMTVTPDGGSTVELTALEDDTPTLTNYTYTPTGNSGVTLKVKEGTGRFVAIGLIAQILPVGTPAPVGNFIAGQGHSGCRITEFEDIGYNTALKNANTYLSATLVEEGAWIRPSA